MNPEAQRIAIAEACGWSSPRSGPNGKLYMFKGNEGMGSEPPDYLNDLNAMHEAEKTLNDSQFDDSYVVELGRLFFPTGRGPWKWSECPTMVVRATASQRAEAFLKATGNWAP